MELGPQFESSGLYEHLTTERGQERSGKRRKTVFSQWTKREIYGEQTGVLQKAAEESVPVREAPTGSAKKRLAFYAKHDPSQRIL